MNISKVYIFGEDFNKKVYAITLKVYSKKVKVCKELKLMNDQLNLLVFSGCVYSISRYFYDYNDTGKCYKYDNKIRNWCKIASINKGPKQFV